jgi:hypothetical protein
MTSQGSSQFSTLLLTCTNPTVFCFGSVQVRVLLSSGGEYEELSMTSEGSSNTKLC